MSRAPGVGRAKAIVLHRARQLAGHLPPSVEAAMVRRRHLRLVTANMPERTDPAFMGAPPMDLVDWIDPDGLPPPPTSGLSLSGFDPSQARGARAWLSAGPYDTDELLARRIDNYGDELGRTLAALRERLMLAERPPVPGSPSRGRALFDARCLQTSTLGPRGIGRFARSALAGAQAAVGEHALDLLVDPGLDPLPPELAGQCRAVRRVDSAAAADYAVFIQPSPMTAPIEPVLPLLHSAARKIAVVFDFIPLRHPTVYLGNPAARAEYAVGLDSLRYFDDFVCISHLAARELEAFLGREVRSTVAWPHDVMPQSARETGERSGPIVVMTGDEPRKNTFGALAAIGAATAGSPDGRDVVVLGMAGHEALVHHLSIWAAMRPGEAVTSPRLSDEDMDELLGSASLVVVASFDEGLSLPVIEALRCGAPVVASDIAAHRELMGAGSFLADPSSPASMARAIRRHRGRSSTHARQWEFLRKHSHESLEGAIGTLMGRSEVVAAQQFERSAIDLPGRSLRVGIATPWWPQRTGVADFSTTTTLELARLADVTVYSTTDADVAGSTPPGVQLASRSIAEAASGGQDVFVSVVGNSHFHLPFLEVVSRMDAVVVSHDTRLVELYMALRGPGGVEDLMLRGTGERHLRPSLDDQIDDMRLLQNAGFWEVARRARMLVLHSPSAAPRIEAETGVTVRLLPFANQRAPREQVLTHEHRDRARARLGLDAPRFAGTVHLASFGFVDVRTKMTDVVVEAAAWLTQWGHRVSLHIVGAASPQQAEVLRQRAAEAGIANFEITGFVDDSQFRDYLLAVDLGVQLRISPLLGVSGPLSDLAAYGTTSVASRGLAVDVDTPDYVDRLPDQISPVIVAEAIEYRLANPIAAADREQLRRDYLARKSPARYAEQFLELLGEAAT